MSEPNGILSDSDKQYLASLGNVSENGGWDGNETQKRFRMRKKIQAALLDFPGISGLPRKEYELIFKDLNDINRGPISRAKDEKTGELITIDWEADQYEALKHMLIFVYNACQLEPDVDFKSLVKRAVRFSENDRLRNQSMDVESRTLSRTRFVDDVSVDIDITYRDQPDVQEIKAKLDRGEGLTREEIGELYLKGEIDKLELTLADLDPQISLDENHPDGFPGLNDRSESVRLDVGSTKEDEKKRRRGEDDEPVNAGDNSDTKHQNGNTMDQ